MKRNNDCDAWVQKVEAEAHPGSALSETWGDAANNTAEGHRQNLDGKTQSEPSLGTNVAIQKKDGKGIHAMLVSKNPDGSVDVAQCTKNPETDAGKKIKEGGADGASESFSYSSVEKLTGENSGWGELHFFPLNDGGDFEQEKPPIPPSRYSDNGEAIYDI